MKIEHTFNPLQMPVDQLAWCHAHWPRYRVRSQRWKEVFGRMEYSHQDAFTRELCQHWATQNGWRITESIEAVAPKDVIPNWSSVWVRVEGSQSWDLAGVVAQSHRDLATGDVTYEVELDGNGAVVTSVTSQQLLPRDRNQQYRVDESVIVTATSPEEAAEKAYARIVDQWQMPAVVSVSKVYDDGGPDPSPVEVDLAKVYA